MTSRQISSGLDLPFAPSTITTQRPTKGELDLLFEAMYNDHVDGQPSDAPRTVLQTSTTSTTIADTAPTPTNLSSHAADLPNTSRDVDELLQQQKHVQQQENQAPLQPKIVADNVPNAMFDGDVFENPFAPPSTSAAKSSFSQYTNDHTLEQVIGEPSRPVLTRNQLRSDGDMCIYALTVSTMELKNVKEAMTDPNHFFKGTIDPMLFIRRFDDDILLYQAKPTEKHLKEVKRIFHYLRGTVNMGLWYTKDSGFELTGFSNVDYAECKDTFKILLVELNS
ncbi:hypothetical protein Tco_0509423 [Tanacetum coccineum]